MIVQIDMIIDEYDLRRILNTNRGKGRDSKCIRGVLLIYMFSFVISPKRHTS